MAGLIDELQRDAADPSVSVAVLLRKVKIASSKLGIDDVTDWVESELNRYSSDPPEYRRIRGMPHAHNPYRGWIPIQGNGDVLDAISKIWVMESVSSLETLVAPPKGAIHYPMDNETIAQLVKMTNVPFYQISNIVQRSQIAAILDTIRNNVLDWALKLERSGITGEGFSFTAQEKIMAKDPAIHIGAIHNFTGNLGSGNKSG
uniref:AbiTii domain-containing protein n=1 Tax=uncultured Rhizobium sp. TaxID=155567 RepID=UPI00262CCEE7